MIKPALLAMAFSCVAVVSHAGPSQGLNWPDPSIPVPGYVRAFIKSECVEFQGWGDETIEECIAGEMYGYRAVVTMLMDDVLGERAAERYRGCSAGLGKIGGRFHRRKADCVSRIYHIVWRFEHSETL